MTLQLPHNDSRHFEHYIRVLPPYCPDPSSEHYPLCAFDVKNIFSTLEDSSWSRELVDTSAVKSPLDRLRGNETLNLEIITEHFAGANHQRDSNQSDASFESFSLLLENFQHSVFEIKRDSQHIATLSLGKQFHRSGETVTGTLDFTHADLTTFQYSVKLEEYEVATSVFTRGDREQEMECIELAGSEAIVWLHDKHSFRLGIPLRCFSSIHSNLLIHRFRLRMTLWVADPKASIDGGVPEWLGCTPDSPHIERFELAVPISVVPLPILQKTVESFSV